MNTKEELKIIDLERKGVRIDQIHKLYRSVSIAQILEVCNNHYQKQNGIKTRGVKSVKKIGSKRKGKNGIQHENV